MPFHQLHVLTRYPEFAEEILLAHGAQSVSFLDAADDPVLEPAPGEAPLWPRTRTVALFDEGQDTRAAVAALHDTLPDGAQAVVTSAALADEDWVRIWLRDWMPLKFGARLWVCPTAKPVHEPGATTVLLDPGLAFGTGTHPTTALCLEWLAGAALAGHSVLDYGCGSGLLAIAALKLGAAHAWAVDLDPQALIATRENAAVNGVADRVETAAPADFVPRPVDLVVANILARPLTELAPRLLECLALRGTLVLSGLLENHADAVRAAYPALRFEPPAVRDGWVRLVARRD